MAPTACAPAAGQVHKDLKELGITASMIDAADPDSWPQALQPNTKVGGRAPACATERVPSGTRVWGGRRRRWSMTRWSRAGTWAGCRAQGGLCRCMFVCGFRV